ncbi:hypothetical protein ACIO1C_27380 [Streptomyces sp. NPDC087420]|uniref:hypothetical protein n=1 Tax=Streptomyces sp. NPDC087420 TaxID=3365785 RepID=UPI003838EE59
MVATAFSAALAFGALAVGGDIGWISTPGGSAASTSAARTVDTGDIGWGSAPKDIGWSIASVGTGA